MKILVLGADGYLGFPLSINLASRGYSVVGIDNLLRRNLVAKVGGKSVTRIYEPYEREKAINDQFSGEYKFIFGDITDYFFLREIIIEEEPDAIANLAQIPSAPYSQMGIKEAWETQRNNEKGTLNLLWILKDMDKTIPVVQIATMGEYGFPAWGELPEGFMEIEYKGRKDIVPVPKNPGSFYHCSKVNMTTNTIFASKIWDLKFTEIYQGVVYGVSLFEDVDPRLMTRYDVDECWGTCLNRFCAQAVIGHPLTVYGKGGQKRGWLSIKDSIQAITLALEKPPKENYRAINQFAETYRVRELADIVKRVGEEMGYNVRIKHIPNPRVEIEEDHYYNPTNKTLKSLGFRQTQSIEAEVRETMEIIDKYKFRIRKELLIPRIRWR